MKIIIIFIFCFANFIETSLADRDVLCTKHLEKRMDLFVARMIVVGNTGRRFPDSEQQIPQFCNETFSMLKTVKDYMKNCMQNLVKQVSSVLIYSLETQLKNQFCKINSKRRSDLLEAADCANKGNKQFQKCLSNYIDSLLGAKNTDDKLKIPHLCCQYKTYKECIVNQGKRVSGCTDKHIDSINNFIDSIAKSLMDMMCGDYESGSDKCSTLGPPPKKRIGQRRPKSILVPIVDLFSSFPEV